MADIVIASLQDNAYAALTAPDELFELPNLYKGLAGVPRPMLDENFDFDSECLTGELLRQAMVPQLSKVSRLAPCVTGLPAVLCIRARLRRTVPSLS